ncbi:Gamma-secretase subunit APH-1B [Hondaea fermentalgiana]|uniref:Gamma-secretase subunit APH-1B n=1 Tax=Hondaea fermentalgiana TaxID=2315210 RepID=A0A2R5GPN8_9STRA|nr:Gamma-secretase subunit APH-1B [Hondaea fermentalgiana]|eukprot:GBG30301.1 Gamma-secretase subunit APH-1B [Hondaea fermentalgiana]
MGFAQFLGVVIFSFGPAAALFFGVLARRAQLVLLAVSAAFMCVMSMVASGVLWYVIKPLQEEASGIIVIGVIFQELFRWALLALYLRADKHIFELIEHKKDHKKLLNDFSSSVAMGSGFGIMSTVLLYGGVLEASLVDGDYFTAACPNISGFVVSSLLCLLYQVMHIALTIVTLDALRRSQRETSHPTAILTVRMLLVLVLHLLVSLLSVMNGDMDLGCKAGMSLQSFSVLLTVAVAVKTARAPSYGECHPSSAP